MWQRLIALVIKEFLALLKDKRGRFVLIGPPIIQVLVFGYAATFDLNRVPYAVYNEDRGVAARRLVAAFRGSPTFREVATIDRQEGIAPLLDAKTVLLVLHIGPRFTDRLLLGESASLQVIIDGRNSNTALVVLDYINRIVCQFNRDWAASRGQPG